ncbi:hypothetical protein [Chitinibacter sp. S2-10]|uniref:DUF7940 domain-containing protein n=1 Tax=Chitinibacter sp. S2-10 TaxID=3373597 RepID=UPI0039779701
MRPNPNRMEWIKNLRYFWRFWSIRLLALIPVLAILAEQLPALRELLPASWYAYVAVAAMVARAIKQSGVE